MVNLGSDWSLTVPERGKERPRVELNSEVGDCLERLVEVSLVE